MLPFDGSWNRKGMSGLPTFPLSTPLLPRTSSLDQTTFLIMGASHSPCLPLNSRLQFPASLLNYSKKKTTSSHWNQESSHFLLSYYEECFHSTCLFSLLQNATPMCLCILYSVLHLELWVHVTMNGCPSHLCGAGCHVRVRPFPNPRAEIPPSSTGWRGHYQTTSYE